MRVIMNIYYRTKDGLTDYGFSFEQQPSGAWRAYILSQPSYRGRDESMIKTHHLSHGGRYYVCWDPEPGTLEDLKKVVRLWAERTQMYIAHNTPIVAATPR
jgi:hypothetical protein